MRQLHCARCGTPQGTIQTGELHPGARVICPNCDDSKMHQCIPQQIPEFNRRPAINRQIANAAREDNQP